MTHGNKYQNMIFLEHYSILFKENLRIKTSENLSLIIKLKTCNTKPCLTNQYKQLHPGDNGGNESQLFQKA